MSSTLDNVIDDFSLALKKKAKQAELKYGFNDDWQREDWREELVSCLKHHIEKGDPRDVALYCVFAWAHGWSLANEGSNNNKKEG